MPGSGKSTYLARLGVHAISSDEIRRILTDDPTDQTAQGRVFAAIRYLLRQRIAIGRPETYIDATHLQRWERRPYIKIAQYYKCEIEAIFFDIPVEICIERNRRRDRIVPEEAIAAMARTLEPPTEEEGFARIHQMPF